MTISAIHQSTSTVSDKVKNRLEQLDDFEDGSVKEMLNLSQQEYVKRIDDLNKALKLAWDSDQKVKALKMAIQVRLKRVRDMLSTNVLHQSNIFINNFFPNCLLMVT